MESITAHKAIDGTSFLILFYTVGLFHILRIIKTFRPETPKENQMRKTAHSGELLSGQP